VTSRHYDVVVLGKSLGALCAAALLARREFRILLLGQGQHPATYHFEGRPLCRRPFTLLGGSSPAWRRILNELAQSPRLRRRLLPLDPMFCFLTPERRVQVPPDMELFGREVDREFAEVRQLVDELYASFAEVNGAADAVFEKDVVWPPGNLWERLETGRAAAALPFISGDSPQDLLGKFPLGHPYRTLTVLPALFASALAVENDQLPQFALARLHGAWTRGIHMLSRGEDELTEFLVERIEAHGGQCLLDRRATSLVVKRGRVSGIIEDGEEEATGASFIVSDFPGETVADLASGRGITNRARRDWPRLTARTGRFVVSLVVKNAGVPEPLGVESFLVPSVAGRADPRRPVVHLQRVDSAAHDPAAAERGETLLVGEILLPRRGPLTLFEAREALLGTIRQHLPFIDEHLVLVDSPHDGLPLYDYTTGVRRDIERIHVTESSPVAEPMSWLWSVDPPGYLELAGEPVRGPIPGTYLVGPTVLPALGQEGELLAAWGAARLITRRDRARQRMRRQMWSKIDMG
jgi:phytoene dehydrogenase-like protein